MRINKSIKVKKKVCKIYYKYNIKKICLENRHQNVYRAVNCLWILTNEKWWNFSRMMMCAVFSLFTE